MKKKKAHIPAFKHNNTVLLSNEEKSNALANEFSANHLAAGNVRSNILIESNVSQSIQMLGSSWFEIEMI